MPPTCTDGNQTLPSRRKPYHFDSSDWETTDDETGDEETPDDEEEESFVDEMSCYSFDHDEGGNCWFYSVF